MKKPEKPQWPQMPMVMTPEMRKFFQECGAIAGNKRNNVVTKQQNAVDDFTARDFGRPRSPITVEGYRPKRHPVGDTASEGEALCGADAGKPEGNNP